MRGYVIVLVGGAVGGLLLALALPPADWGWLGGVCLVPVFAAVAGRGLLRGFIGGITVPLVAALAIQSNLLYHVPNDVGSPSWVLVGCGFFGFVIAIVSCVASETRVSGWRRIGLLAALAVLLEFGLFPIMPAHLALTQYRAPGMLFLAGVGGIWLVSLLLWATNFAAADALSLWRGRGLPGRIGQGRQVGPEGSRPQSGVVGGRRAGHPSLVLVATSSFTVSDGCHPPLARRQRGSPPFRRKLPTSKPYVG